MPKKGEKKKSIQPEEKNTKVTFPSFFPYTAGAPVLAAAWFGVSFFPSLLYRTRGGGARLRRPSLDRTLTIFP